MLQIGFYHLNVNAHLEVNTLQALNIVINYLNKHSQVKIFFNVQCYMSQKFLCLHMFKLLLKTHHFLISLLFPHFGVLFVKVSKRIEEIRNALSGKMDETEIRLSTSIKQHQLHQSHQSWENGSPRLGISCVL